MNSSPSIRLLFAVVTISCISNSSFAIHHRDADRFSSSTVHYPNDFSLSRGHEIPSIDDATLPSSIDRDPYLHDHPDADDPTLLTLHQTFSRHNPSSHWSSPLERLSPLTSPVHPNTPTTNSLRTLSTGTTLAALLINSTTLIIGSDTRSTDSSTVANKHCEKLHPISENIWCAGAGTSADVDALIGSVRYFVQTRGGFVGNAPTKVSLSVPAVIHHVRSRLLRSRGQLGVNLLLGGYDRAAQRAYLAAIHPHGSMDVVTYAALGSGGLAATAVLEDKGGVGLEEGLRLVVEAVRAGVENDLGSGGGVDVVVIGREGVWYRRSVVGEEVLEWEVERKGEIGGNDGVNGFGNIPFEIRSKREIVSGRSLAEGVRRKWLDGILGIVQWD